MPDHLSYTDERSKELRKAVDDAIGVFVKERLSESRTLAIDLFQDIERIREEAYGSINWAIYLPAAQPDETEEMVKCRVRQAIIDRAVNHVNVELEKTRVGKVKPVQPGIELIDYDAKMRKEQYALVKKFTEIRDTAYDMLFVTTPPEYHEPIHKAMTKIVVETLGVLDEGYLVLEQQVVPKGSSVGYMILPEEDLALKGKIYNLAGDLRDVFEDINS